MGIADLGPVRERIRAMNESHPALRPFLKSVEALAVYHSDVRNIDAILMKALDSRVRLAKLRILEGIDYPPIKLLGDLDRMTEFETFASSLEGPYSPKQKKLSVITTDRCEFECVHCVGDYKPTGRDLSFSLLQKADPEFFRTFESVGFSIDGDSLRTVSSDRNGQRKELADYFDFFHGASVRNFALFSRGIKKNDRYALASYGNVMDFFSSHADSGLTLIIGFNLFRPRDFQNPGADFHELKDEVSSLLSPALGKKNVSIEIGMSGSYKRSLGHIDKAAHVLRELMDEHGFAEYGFLEYVRNVCRDNPEDLPDPELAAAVLNDDVSDVDMFRMLLDGDRTGLVMSSYIHPDRVFERSINRRIPELMAMGLPPEMIIGVVKGLLDGRRRTDNHVLWQLSELYYQSIDKLINFLLLPETPPLEKRWPIPPASEVLRFPIGDFYNIRTGQEINVTYNPVFRLGRYAKLVEAGKAGEDLNERLDEVSMNQMSEGMKRICECFFNMVFSLLPDGSLRLCASAFGDKPFLGRIDEPAKVIFERYLNAMERARISCRKNLIGIMNGNYSSWLCEHPEWIRL